MKSTLRNAALAALVAVGTVFAVGTPAHAVTLAGTCYGNGQGTIWLNASVIYFVDSSGWQFFTTMEGNIHSNPFAPGGDIGNKNNVDLFLYQDGAQNWAKYSPDNIAAGSGFSANPNRALPDWSSVYAKVTGTFDKKNTGDPSCDWTTPTL